MSSARTDLCRRGDESQKTDSESTRYRDYFIQICGCPVPTFSFSFFSLCMPSFFVSTLKILNTVNLNDRPKNRIIIH